MRVCPKCPNPKSSTYKLWSCGCSWTPYSSYDKYGVLSVSSKSAQSPNPIYINCGPVVTLGRPTDYTQNMVCLACLPKCPNPKSSTHKLWSCGCSWPANNLSAKYGVLTVSTQIAQFPNPVYINCGPVVALGRPTYYLQNMVCFACLPKVPDPKIQYI